MKTSFNLNSNSAVSAKTGTNEPMAIVGLGCRFPGGVTDAESYWSLMSERRSGIREVPAERWDWRKFYHSDSQISGKIISRWGSFVDDYDQFDANLFGITPREAQLMDPQQRWLLETSWRALEDAGINPDSLAGASVGVFVGISASEIGDRMHGDDSLIDIHSGTGGALSIAANRLSFIYDFKGPSMAVDTACSSALVAIALAVRSIQAGDCDMALAGGSNALLSPKIAMTFSRATMLSPDGQCFTFDARANGYVRGEGAGIIVIKRLSTALLDGDRIYAVIRGAHVNQDGHSSSLTVPSMESQEVMLREAYAQTGIDPATVSYVEAHGTGTPVGDPIEAHAIGHVFGARRKNGNRCLIGSVKTNIGHLEPASGIAGVIKSLLIFQHDSIPPNLNFEKNNPLIPLDDLGLQVVTDQTPLPRYGSQLPIIGINSFGFGGTNAHIVLEQAPPTVNQDSKIKREAQRSVILPLSAVDHETLTVVTDNFQTFLKTSDQPIEQIAASAGKRRAHLQHRAAIIGRDAKEIRSGLREFLNGSNSSLNMITGQIGNPSSAPVFVFTGQGVQWWGMGQGLLEREPIIRQTIEKIDETFSRLSGWSLLNEMKRTEAESRINDTDVAQPAIFALQVALVELWKSWGIKPDFVVGHSVGEVAAAYTAGIYSLEDAVKIIFHRSRLQHTTAGRGSMAAVGLSLGEALYKLNGDNVQIAAINGSRMLTLAGENEPLARFVAELAAKDVFVRELPIQYAFHTDQMDCIQEELLTALSDIHPQTATTPFISTVTGKEMEGTQMTADYWWQNVRKPVSFASALTGLVQAGENTFLEIGPHPALSQSIHECLLEQQVKGHVFHSLRRDTNESDDILANVGRMYVAGISMDWEAINQAQGSPMRLPIYPMQYQAFETMSESFRQYSLEPLAHPLLGIRIDAPLPTWELILDPRVLNYLADHQIWKSIVFPGAGYAEMALGLAAELFPDENYVVEDLAIKRVMFIHEQRPPKVRITYNVEDHSISIYSTTKQDIEWQLHAVAFIRKLTSNMPEVVDIPALLESMGRHIDRKAFYESLINRGYGFGPEFQHVQNIWMDEQRVLGEVHATEMVERQSCEYHFHPALLDACVQAFSAAGFDDSIEELPYLPAGFGSIRIFQDPMPAHFWVVAHKVEQTDYVLVIDLFIYDDNGRPIGEIIKARFDHVKQSALLNDELSHVYQFHWKQRRLRAAPLPIIGQIPSVNDVVTVIENSRPDIYDKYQLANFFQVVPHIMAANLQIIQNTFLQLGWDAQPGDTVRFEDLVDQLGIIPRHYALFLHHIDLLADALILQAIGSNEWLVLENLKHGDVEKSLNEIISKHSRSAVDVELFGVVSKNLVNFYRGQSDPQQVLFPEGSTKLLQDFYDTGAEQPPHYEMIAVALRDLCNHLPEGRPLRILEVGAGTGALTAVMFEKLPMEQVEYTFTDVSQIFLKAARKRFAGFPSVDYMIFDLNEALETQGVVPHSFDVVIAANVLHTISDLDQVFASLKHCLTPDGLLLFMELTRRDSPFNTVFGLLPEWWKEDAQTGRKDFAIQSNAQWLANMEKAGFQQASALGCSPNENEGWCSTFIARSAAVDPMPQVAGVPAKTMLIFADQQGLSDKLAAGLELVDVTLLRVIPGESFEQIDKTSYILNPAKEEQLRALFNHLADEGQVVNQIVVAWGLDHATTDQMDEIELVASQETGVLFALRLAQMISEEDLESAPKLVFLTRDGQSALPEDRHTRLDAGMLTGFVRVVNNEYPSYQWRLIDLDPIPTDDEIQLLIYDLLLDDKELEVAYRAGVRYVNRLQRLPLDSLPRIEHKISSSDAQAHPYRLEILHTGRISNLSLNLTERKAPAPGEIEVQVKAAGLNFRDLMKVLGLYPGKTEDLTWLGDDIAGVVIGVGEGVSKYQVGDEVFGFAPYGFRSQLSLDARLVFKKPAHLSFEQAAAIPTVFITAHYALIQLAQLQPGESVLIHAGTGGVGQAAIQIAQNLGLEIFATAGSPEKRAYLREQGVQHVFNSRTLDFADEIMSLTNGRGVDAVLNSLAGDFIPKNLSVLAPFGRYLEIGKIDIYNNSKLGMEALRNNISFHIIDVGQMLTTNIDRVQPITQAIEEKFAQSIFRPLDTTVFPISEAQDAFRYMATAQHIGKIILSFDQSELTVGASSGGKARFRSDGAYLIVGGTRGFGLEIFRWMANQGARHFTLMSRGGVIDKNDFQAIEALRKDGVRVEVVQGDVTQMADVERVVAGIQAGDVPLSGVVHSAMILRDGLISEQRDESVWSEALWVKAAGGWNLHRATLDIPLEHFICISSSTSIYGGATQSNYSAGNAFLDGLAHYRRARGLPALTVNYGAMSGTGHLDRHKDNADFLNALGLKLIPFHNTLAVMGELLQIDSPQSGVFIADWSSLGRALPMVVNSKVYSDVISAVDLSGSDDNMLEQILLAPAHARPEMLRRFLVKALSDVMDTNLEQIEFDASLSNLGLDSLMSVELVNLMNKQLSAINMTIGVSEVLGVSTIQDIANVMLRKFQREEGLSEAVSDLQYGNFNFLSALDGTRQSDIDWEIESVLDPEIVIPESLPLADQTAHILLTGATGFLGAYLLHDLLNQTNADISCLVRAEDDAGAFQRVSDNLQAYGLWQDDFADRIHTVLGDIGLPQLGLKAEDFERLAGEIDSIVHNASTVNLLQSYRAIKPINVQGIEEILKLAVTTQLKAVHYISTASVFYATLDNNRRITESDWGEPDRLPNGYRQSKWVAEQLIRQAMERGIPCTIYRPGIVSGDSRSGVTNLNDMTSRMVIGTYQLKAMVERDIQWNMIPVDYVSRAIVHIFKQPNAAGNVFHLTHPKNTHLSEIVDWIGFEGKLQTLSYPDWRTALIQQAQSRIENSMIPLLPLFPEVESDEIVLDVACDNTLNMLVGSDITCPPIDAMLLSRYTQFMLESGVLQSPTAESVQ